MQFHLNGFRSGDPNIADMRVPESVPVAKREEVDVLIVGCGPAGLTLAAQLARFPDITTRIVEQKDGPLELGQADGIACRTMEMFQAFGFAERVLREAYWVNETTFWKPDETCPQHITRSGRIEDTEKGLSEFPHVILNQARVHDFYLDAMRNAPSRLEPDYSRRLVSLQISLDGDGEAEASDYRVTARLERLDPSHAEQSETIRARYVVGCDGARSSVRKLIGQELRGEAANQAWGVMDVLAVTDFPDIRLKSLIQSANEGSIVLIPREGGYLVRIYVELDKLSADERVANRNITVEHLISAAQRILSPFTLEVKEVAWWSVYEIGQRLCDRFDDVPKDAAESRLPRVFIAGDACHTHSPKAGQGMNVSMQDAFNLGWKLAGVLRGRYRPELLHSYSAERQAIAAELIDFDREWAAMLSAPLKSAANPNGVEPAQVQHYFVRHGRYTAGTATLYKPSVICGDPRHQNLAKGLRIGARLHSAPVIRLADAKPVELGHSIEADGRWRIFAFADSSDPASADAPIANLCRFLAEAPDSPLLKYRNEGEDIDAIIDFRAVFQQPHRELRLGSMPSLLLPAKGRHGLRDYEKMFCADPEPGRDIFELRQISRERGCIVIVRPDQYVAHILPIDGYRDLTEFFENFMVPASLPASIQR